MKLRIDAFRPHSDHIPQKYTCDGEELSPGLVWEEAPEGTKSFAVLMEDLDVPGRSNPFVLWLVYNIPANVSEMPKGKLPEGVQVGLNDAGKTQYTGPCPKPGDQHERFSVQVYALDAVLDLAPGVTKDDFFRAAKDHILERIEAIGIYERFKK